MIEPISDVPSGVTGFRIVDELTDADYADVLAPGLRAAAAAGTCGCCWRRRRASTSSR